jgi:hypothetical protein
LTSVRNALVASKFACPDPNPTTDQQIDPTMKTTNPQPVTRAPRLAAVIIAAIIVAIGATHPAIVSSVKSSARSLHNAPLRKEAPGSQKF